ncbi:MAG: general secretion pathway protein GspK [Candidatus Binatia bacterium]|nr:general secretion pathway protein GspK [Candidatus Binatia bacterium]
MTNDRGVILVVVIWALTVGMVIAAELARAMRIEGLAAATYHEEVQAYYLAVAGVHRAVYAFMRAAQQGQTLLDHPDALNTAQEEEEKEDIWARGDGRWLQEEYGAGGYWVRVSDEGGKINLNQADEATLRRTFAHLGLDAKLAEALTDAIQDWRDPDPLVRLHGAETDYYRSLPVPYSAKDGLFDTPDELLLVRGVTPALFYGTGGGGLRDLFTTYNTGGTVNLLTAGPLVLQAVLGIDAATARDIVQQRAEGGRTDLANLLPGIGGMVNFGLPVVVTIESIGYLHAGGVTRHVSAVVQRLGPQRFRFLRWQDRYPSPSTD